MALIKEHVTRYGATGEYWRVAEILLGQGNHDKLVVELHVSSTTREDHCDPIEFRSYRFLVQDSPFRDGDCPWTVGYAYLKKLTEFEGAEDA